MRLATQADRPAVEAFLNQRFATSMFPLAYLSAHGMSGDHPQAMSFLIFETAGQITDVFAVSNAGVIFPQCPNAPWPALAAVLAGKRVTGLAGETAQVAACCDAFALPSVMKVDDEQIQYSLPLCDMIMPDTGGFALKRLQDVDQGLLLRWRAAFSVESMSRSKKEAAGAATHEITSYIEKDTHRVLMKGNVPVAMTGFNSVLPRAVQVGGVYTPPNQRSQGYARRAVAMHLAQAAQAGVTDAVLAATTAAAARAYEAVGFRPFGHFRFVVFDGPQVIGG